MGVRLGPYVVAVVLIGTATAVGGCRFVAPQAGARCAWMSQSPPSGGRTAILVDTSNSTRAVGTRAGAPDYPTAMRAAVRAAVDRRDTVAVAGFSGTEADLAWSARDRSTDWQVGNPNADNQRDRRGGGGGGPPDPGGGGPAPPPRGGGPRHPPRGLPRA